jgi:hypothetical protein
LEYIHLLQQMMNDIANMPQVAFGRGMRGSGSDSGGSSSRTSGIALQMAMSPVVERAKTKRIFWDIVLKNLARMVVYITAVKDPDMLPFSYAAYNNYDIAPVFAPILPRDRLAVVNEVVARSNALLMSIPRALEVLGEEDISAEDGRIRSDARFKARLGLMAAPVPGGKNSDRGNGGSSSQQNGPGSKSRRSGSPAKEA